MSRKTQLLLAAVPVALLALVFGLFAIDRAITSGEIPKGVSAAGIDLGGLGEDDAKAALRAYEVRLLEPALFVIKDSNFDLDPATVGVGIDEDAILAEAMDQPRSSFFGLFSTESTVRVPVSVDEALIDGVLDGWEKEAIARPAYEGGVIIREGRALPDYPRAGEGIDRAASLPLAVASLTSVDRSTVELPTRSIDPALTSADIDAAAEEAALMIGQDIILVATDPELAITFPARQLAAAFRTEIRSESDTEIVQWFDPEYVRGLLARHRADIEEPPRDADFEINLEDDTVTLLPGRARTIMDEDLVAEQLKVIALVDDRTGENGERVGDYPFAFGEDPEFTTEMAEAMGPITLEGWFTTNHPAGQARVTNIHLMADAVDGAVVQPGEEFSLNEHVGERTRDKGYVLAPMILAGELVDSVGGGVSQFATTFYNAVFFGCYEDVEHKPHSYYFSRYPEVNEATISWPTPHLIFRNNTDAILIIRTQYTSSSITVKFFGNNKGKTCERELGSRFGYSNPPTKYEGDPTISPLDEAVKQNGAQGWANTVKRIITHADGTVEEEVYTWRYSAQPKIILVHPCNVPDSEEECPIIIPDVVGMTEGDATAALQAAGFVVAVGTPVETDQEALDGIVASQSASDWLPAGSTVTISVYTYVPPPEE